MDVPFLTQFHLNPACILEVLCKHKMLMEQILLKMLATVTTSIEQLELSEKGIHAMILYHSIKDILIS